MENLQHFAPRPFFQSDNGAGERPTWEPAAGGTKGFIVASLRSSGALFLPTAEQSNRIPERYDEIPERRNPPHIFCFSRG